jgi:hypothetical protein
MLLDMACQDILGAHTNDNACYHWDEGIRWEKGSASCSRFPHTAHFRREITNKTDILTGYGKCGKFGVAGSESECCCCYHGDCSEIGVPVASISYYEPIHRVCVPFEVSCPKNIAGRRDDDGWGDRSSLFDLISDCSCSREIEGDYAAGKREFGWWIAVLLFPVEILVSFVLFRISKPGYRSSLAVFYILATVTFLIGMWFVAYHALWTPFANEIYLVFALEAMQLLIFFVSQWKGGTGTLATHPFRTGSSATSFAVSYSLPASL